MKALFTVSVAVDKPIVVGQDNKNGRRQLIPITSGTVEGCDINGAPLKGTVLPGGVDSQVIRPDGKCELSARYGIRLENGESFYIENNGIRTVPEAYVEKVLYYFATVPTFEAYSDNLRWLEKHVFYCKAIRETAQVKINYYVVE